MHGAPKVDGLIKSLFCSFVVIPAKAGIQEILDPNKGDGSIYFKR